MGISPVISLTPLPAVSSIEREFEPLPMQRVENSARTGDETYSPSNGRSSRGAEDDEPEEELEELPVEEETGSAVQPTQSYPGRPVSFFV
jgi:hypothetical protein